MVGRALLSLSHGHLGQEKEEAAPLVLIQLLYGAVPFQNMAAETLCPALHSGDLIPCPSIVHTCSSSFSFSKKTLPSGLGDAAFFQWRLELVAKTRLARDLGWSMALHKEHIP